jgi:enhancer of mRNA-decapping protein 4
LDPQEVFAMSPPVLNQALLLSLTQQLGCDLGTDAELKLDWMQQTLISLDPEDALLGAHMRPILDQLHHSLTELGSHSTSAAVQRSLRMVVHLVNSLISQCG